MKRSLARVALALGAALIWGAGAPAATSREEGRVLYRRNCALCHGEDGSGTSLGPDLTDGEWLHADGSYESIVALVKKGVPRPKRAPGPMLPMGGAALTDEQVAAVACYVYGLTRGPTPAPGVSRCPPGST